MLLKYAPAVVLACLAASPTLAANEDPSGTWFTQNGKARIRLEHCPSSRERMCGYVVWMSQPNRNGQPAVDQYNPDPSKAGRMVLGHQMLLGLAPNSDGQYVGKVYNAEDGKSYDVTVYREAGTPDLKVKGCLLVFCKTESWARVTDVAQGQLTGSTGSANGPQADPEWGGGRAAPAPKRDAKPKS